MTKHVVSTLSADTRYATWVTNSGVGTILRSVTVKGGAGVASRGRGESVTPEGKITHLSDEDARFLSEHKLFKEHQARGVVKIISMTRDPDTVARSMAKDDGSRPKNEKDVKDYADSIKKKGQEPIQAMTNKH